MINLNNLRIIAFDADDTLWDCQSHFEAVENHLYRLIAPYCETPSKELFLTESGNMDHLDYRDSPPSGRRPSVSSRTV